MFKLVLSDIDILKNSIPIVSEIIDEANLVVDKSGISLLAPDRTMVSVVDLKILPTAFDSFDVSSDTALGLNMANLTAILKRVKSSDKLHLEYDSGKLVLKAVGRGVRTFSLPLIEVKSEKPPIDQLKFPVRIEVESSIIEEGIADAEVIGDSVFLEAEPSVFRMHAKGDVSSAHLELKQGDSGLLGVHAPERAKSQYPLDYLKKMIKAAKLAPQTVVEFGKDYPMRLDFRQVDKLQMRFILAPRVSEE
ncbi:MAG: proliferating cell nuclear antigen (pcna) [Candidatus Aenigmarchaeota archaeon]|nr:proliferating cell nuclear antigen (pcna) [Candidatus Aenigmarchaeota archaeon]